MTDTTIVRAYATDDVAAMRRIWNEVVEAGDAFPQTVPLSAGDAGDFFADQTYCGVAADVKTGEVLGLYILHPNNVGRVGHICNTSYAVASKARGRHIGRVLVADSLDKGFALGFRILQFNAVVATNAAALHLYAELGFSTVGTIPEGFLMPDGRYEDIVIMYHTLP